MLALGIELGVPYKGEKRVNHYATLACNLRALRIKFESNKLDNL